jgi:hypothetical protein
MGIGVYRFACILCRRLPFYIINYQRGMMAHTTNLHKLQHAFKIGSKYTEEPNRRCGNCQYFFPACTIPMHSEMPEYFRSIPISHLSAKTQKSKTMGDVMITHEICQLLSLRVPERPRNFLAVTPVSGKKGCCALHTSIERTDGGDDA